MVARCLCLLWLTSALVVFATGAAAEESRLGGGMRFYGGTGIERPLRLPDDAASQTLRWRIAVNRTTVAQGVVTVKREDPWLRIPIPAVERRVDARLVLVPEEGDGSVESIELYPPSESARRLSTGEPLGWVGAKSPLTLAGAPLALARTPLADAGAVRRFRGKVLVVPPTTHVDDVLSRALLERAARGTAILAIGVDHAPWAAADADAEAPAVEGAFLDGLRDGVFDAWGRGGSALGSPLRPPEGNFTDLVPGYARAHYPEKGLLVLAQLRLFETLDDEPAAAELLARLLELARRPPRRLSAPRTVVVAWGSMPRAISTLFGTKLGEGPAVVVTNGGNPAQSIAKEEPPAVVLGGDGSLFLPDKGMLTGPGLDALKGDRRAEFLRFLTIAGLRVKSERYWR